MERVSLLEILIWVTLSAQILLLGEILPREIARSKICTDNVTIPFCLQSKKTAFHRNNLWKG
jgi:hypothetical protein